MKDHRWLSAWSRAGKALQEIKRAELQALDYSDQWKIIDEMLQWACDHRIDRTSTGLLEFQKFILANRDKLTETKHR